MSDRSPHSDVSRAVDGVRGERGTQSPERTGEADPRVFARRGRVLFEANDGPDAGDEHGRRCLDAIALKRLHVPHLVHIDRQHDANRELPPPNGPVYAGRQKHTEQRPRLGQTEQQQLGLGEEKNHRELELREQRADGAETGGTLAPSRARLASDRLAVDRPTEGDDARGDGLVLGRVSRQQVEGLAPRCEGPARVSRLPRALCFGGQSLQLVSVDQSLA